MLFSSDAPRSQGDPADEVESESFDADGLVIFRWLERMSLADDHYVGSRAALVSQLTGMYLPGGGPIDAAPRTVPGDEPRFLARREGVEAHWADGVLLCKVVERLERVRGGIPGTVLHPRTRAQATQNVRRSLDVLRGSGRFRRGRFDEEGLEEALLEGRRLETMALFAEIKRAYSNRVI
jgi:hypothetical protein